MSVIIRDFAYDSNDPRFHGTYPLPSSLKEVEDKEDIENDIDLDDDGIDFSLWEWKWFYDNSKSRAKDTPPVIALGDLNTSILPEVVNIFQSKLDGETFSLIRMKTIFPFVKGTEYEMSLETLDELLIVKTAPLSISTANSELPQVKERWTSIDEVPTNKSVAKKGICLALDPPVDSFLKEINQFLGYNKSYGDGWMTALKVKIVGNWTTGRASLQLVDLGLVPGNYCEE